MGGMAFRRKVFVSQKISVLLGDGRELRLQALVSAYGAKYVFQESELPPEMEKAIGTEVEILYKKVPVRCRVVKESNSAGTVYSLRFLKPSSLLLKQINRDIEENGLPSPWIRGLPRLSTDAKHLPVPALVVVDHDGDSVIMNVRNFTLGGMLLEYVGGPLEEVGLGRPILFDIVTNSGDKISDIAGKVTHVSVEESSVDDQQNRYHFGVRFEPMGHQARIKYKALILEHCRGLRYEATET